MEYITRGRCGQEGCRERRYYLDNGLWFCRRGHQQEGRQIEEDPDDFGTQGKRSRVKKAAAEKGSKIYHGRQAYSLFLQTYQLILWKQCFALVQNRGFPAEFEHVIRDLWALRLETYASKIRDPDDDDEELEFFSSQPGTDTEDNMNVPETLISGGKHVQWPRLIDSIALCYLGALLMRLPVSVGDFHRMILQGDVPYFRILRTIPREMRNKLPQEYLALLETTRLLKEDHLQKAVFDLLLLYHNKFDVQFAPLNFPALLFRYIRRLALPVEIYSAVKRLRELLGFTFAYPTKIVGSRRPLHFPEMQLVTLIVIATKLLFPFDDIERYPVSAKEPTTQVMDWRIWAHAQRQFDNRKTSSGGIGKGKEIMVTDQDVFSMTPAQLDQYMDWYEQNWLDDSKGSNPLADMFPISSSTGDTQQGAQPKQPSASAIEEDEAAITSMLQTVNQELKPRKVNPDTEADIPRPGSAYPRYRLESDLTDSARVFYETAAKISGLSLSTLVRAVSHAESRIMRWLEDQRRMEYFGDSFDIESAEEDSDDDFEKMSDGDVSDIDD